MPEQIQQIKAGYEFAGGALEFGAAVKDGTAYPRPRSRSPGRDQPARPGRRRHRHRQDQDPAAHGRAALEQGGVPVFLADVKGDLSGMASRGQPNDKITARAADIGEEWVPTAYPTEFYRSVGLGKGIPIRASVSSFGPTLLAKVLGLNETQESSLAWSSTTPTPRGCGSMTSRTCGRSSST
jgi:hypothetical protein